MKRADEVRHGRADLPPRSIPTSPTPSALWKKISAPAGQVYTWPKSTYIAEPPFFTDFAMTPGAVGGISGAKRARHLRRLGHHRPHLARRLDQADLARRHLPAGARRRGRRLQQLRRAPRQPRGDDARHLRQRAHQEPDAAGHGRRRRRCYKQARSCRSTTRRCSYIADGTPTVVFGGEEYGTGSSRDWAAKGTQLLGVKAVIARSFERIHRSNLVGMGVLPLQFTGSDSAASARHQGRRDVRRARARQHRAAAGAARSRIKRSRRDERRTITVKSRIDTRDRGRLLQARRHPAATCCAS